MLSLLRAGGWSSEVPVPISVLQALQCWECSAQPAGRDAAQAGMDPMGAAPCEQSRRHHPG